MAKVEFIPEREQRIREVLGDFASNNPATFGVICEYIQMQVDVLKDGAETLNEAYRRNKNTSVESLGLELVARAQAANLLKNIIREFDVFRQSAELAKRNKKKIEAGRPDGV